MLKTQDGRKGDCLEGQRRKWERIEGSKERQRNTTRTISAVLKHEKMPINVFAPVVECLNNQSKNKTEQGGKTLVQMKGQQRVAEGREKRGTEQRKMRLSHCWGSRGTITEKYILARFLLPAIWVVSIVCRFGLLTIYCLGYFGKRGIVLSLIVMGGRWEKFFCW